MISILMASYNTGKYIGEAIQSVLAQTLQDWELIIVDDVSTDNTADILNSQTDKRINVIWKEQNEGYGEALSSAISHATRPIIGILDADDVLRSDELQIMANAHSEQKYGLIYSQFDMCDVNLCRRSKGFSGPVPPGSTYLDMVREGKTPDLVHHFKTFTRAAYDLTPGFTSRRRTVDKDIALKLEEVTSLKFVDVPLYLYRMNPEGISHDLSTTSFREEVIVEAMARRCLSA